MTLIKKLAHALHHMFNPHCSHCESLRERDIATQREHELELRVCQSCETLKTQLEFANSIIRELTRPQVVTEETPDTSNLKPIVSAKHKPWAVVRASLERADKIKAQELKQQRQVEINLDNLDEVVAESLGK